jgi:hypothetical protein
MKSDRRTIFNHHIYELKKGLRNLILFTMPRSDQEAAVRKLKSEGLAYLIQPVAPDSDRVNIYFGNEVCIAVLARINKPYLVDFTEEEDFMLGIMLGYDRIKQCERYLREKERKG